MPNWTFNRMVLTLPCPKRWEPINKRQTRWEIFRNLKYKYENFQYDIENEQCELFQIIKPRPKEQDENWNNWNICNWGTKWEPKIYKFEIVENTIMCVFETPWTHPYEIYLYLEELGFEIEYSHASYENCDFGWGGNEWYDPEYYEIPDLDYEDIHEELKNENELYYFDRLIHAVTPELDENRNEEMINFMINCLAYHFDALLEGYFNWRLENNIDETDEIKKNNMKLKNKIMEWIEDQLENNIINENEYIIICNSLKNSNYENTHKKYEVILKNRFNMTCYYDDKKYEPNLLTIYC